MSAVGVVNYLLSNAAAVIAVVPAARIFTGPIPQTESLPSIGIIQISGTEYVPVKGTSRKLFTHRVQVTVHAKSYAQKKAVLALAYAALDRRKGTINSVSVDSITPAGEGPDLDDLNAEIFEQSHDYAVAWYGTAP